MTVPPSSTHREAHPTKEQQREEQRLVFHGVLVGPLHRVVAIRHHLRHGRARQRLLLRRRLLVDVLGAGVGVHVRVVHPGRFPRLADHHRHPKVDAEHQQHVDNHEGQILVRQLHSGSVPLRKRATGVHVLEQRHPQLLDGQRDTSSIRP